MPIVCKAIKLLKFPLIAQSALLFPELYREVMRSLILCCVTYWGLGQCTRHTARAEPRSAHILALKSCERNLDSLNYGTFVLVEFVFYLEFILPVMVI